MSISLKALYDQVQSIKNSGLSVSEWSKLDSGYILFNNGLLINYGASKNRKVTFIKQYPNKVLQIVVSPHTDRLYSSYAEHYKISSLTNSGYQLATDDTYKGSRYIAIGYLISNSIRSLLGGGLGWL